MTDIVISVENLGKRYLVGHQAAQRERYHSLRDAGRRSEDGEQRTEERRGL